jgi:CubicO group peptidase (beta-lactamase class C family)
VKDPIQLADPFQLASVSKMFTAMAIMILREKGAVDYDVDVKNYLPTFPYPGVTVRMLMTHRAGMPNYMYAGDEHWPDKSKPLDNDAMLRMLVDYKPEVVFPPDKGFSYNNTNYALLANIVEAVSGQHFDEFVKENIFEPLDMDNSFVYNLRGESIVPPFVEKGIPGFHHRGRSWREMPNDYLNGVMGDKNVYTTIEDLYKFDRGLDQFSLVPEDFLKEAFSQGSPGYRNRKDNYGFGWRIKADMDSTVYHFGWWKGFRTFYIRDMKYQKTLIVLTNKEKGPGSSHLWDIILLDTLPLGCCSDFRLEP